MIVHRACNKAYDQSPIDFLTIVRRLYTIKWFWIRHRTLLPRASSRFQSCGHQGSTSGEKKKVIIMFKTVGDLIKALQQFPPTAQVQADNKAIQNVSAGPTSIGGVVQISTTAPA